jgi:hypothetical protein
MHARHFLHLSVAGSLLAVLAACGDSDSDPAASTDATQQAAFASDYGTALAALGSYGGLTNAALVEQFDDAFLDAGYTKGQLRDNLAQEAAAVAVAPDLSSFPMARLSNVTIGDCDAAGVCTLNATLTNADADTTAVTFTTQVKYGNGRFRLYGDQKSA